MTAQTQPDVRDVLGPLINAFGEAQWQSGRGVPHRDLDQLFDAIINGAERLRSRPALSDEQCDEAIDACGLSYLTRDCEPNEEMLRKLCRAAHGIGTPT